MLNSFQLEHISKEDVKLIINDIVDVMNTHQFEKLKNKLNKMGVLNDVRK